jgi:hypothetical protein
LFRENVTMTAGPACYVPDVTDGIVRVEDLPKAKVLRNSRVYARRDRPRCSRSAPKTKTYSRTLHDLGDLAANRPIDRVVTYSQHYCSRCKRSFNADMSDLALPHSLYTHRVVALAVRLVVEDGLPYRSASWHLWRDHRVFVPFATIQNWLEAGGKKSRRTDHR